MGETEISMETQVIPVDQTPGEDFEIIWNNLSYTVTKSGLARTCGRLQGQKNLTAVKAILRNVSGRVKSRQLVAVMGPSGAGKSTLLECIFGKRKTGKTGEIYFRGRGDEGRVKMSFIPQQDRFLQVLTVRETITFASKLQNSTKQLEGTLDTIEDAEGRPLSALDSKYHTALVNKTIKQLGLDVCADNRVSNCSGGQLKRVSIAQELVGKPTILILDEPTSGLDSTSCLQVVQLLRDLTQGAEPIAMMATIHQPSIKVFDLFHKVYNISVDGRCIYEGPPSEVANYFADFDLICPKLYNPADFAIEISLGDYGMEKMLQLADAHHKNFADEFAEIMNSDVPLKSITELSKKRKYPTLKHTWYHIQRTMITTIRDPLVFGMRFSTQFIVAAFLGALFGPVGFRGGCPPSIGGDFEPSDLGNATDDIENQLTDTYNNTGNQFFNILFMMFNALMPTCMAFPLEMLVFTKEKQNGWYDIPSYYWGKQLAEVPFQVTLPPIYVAIVWKMTEQVPHLWRFINYSGMMIIIAFIGQSLGYIIGAVYMNSMAASIYMAPLSCIPFILFSGIFIKVSAMPVYLSFLSYACYIRFGIEGLLITLYGFDRCGEGASKRLLEAKEGLVVWLGAMLGTFDDEVTTVANDSYVPLGNPSIIFVEELVDTFAGKFISDDGVVQSSVMVYLDIYDHHIYRAWAGLIILLIAKRIIAYLIIVRKVNANQ